MGSHSRYAVVVLVVALLTAGCLSGGPGSRSPAIDERSPGGTAATTAEPTETAPTTSTGTATAEPTETATAFSWEQAADQPDPNKSIDLENDLSEPVNVTVRVIRNATGETVHEETYRLAADERRTVYDTGRVGPDGVEEFTFVVSVRNQTQAVSIETNACYGNAGARIDRDGELGVFYAIC